MLKPDRLSLLRGISGYGLPPLIKMFSAVGTNLQRKKKIFSNAVTLVILTTFQGSPYA